VGPLASWLTAWLDGWWRHAESPDPFTVVVVSGDDGDLAAAVLDCAPACGRALRYVAVDPDRAEDGGTQPPARLSRLPKFEDPAFLYPAADLSGPRPPGLHDLEPATGDSAAGDPAGGPDQWELDLDERPLALGIGPLITFLTDVPSLGEGDGVIVAVEVLSRRPYDLFEWRDGAWWEVRVTAAGAPGRERMVEVAVPAGDDAPPDPGPHIGVRWRRQVGARQWLGRMLTAAPGGALAVVDRWQPASVDDEPAADSLDLAQLSQVRHPIDGAVPLPGTPLSVVTWGL
jgi:hypothetical protein